MARKKTNNKYKPDYNASCSLQDNFGMIYESMVLSEAYKSLTIGQKQMYTLCRIQANSEQGRRCLYRHGEQENITYNVKTDFVFPEKHMERYGIKGQNGRKYMKDLIDKGFIVLKEKNSHRRKPNVYSFCSKWKDQT